MKPSGWSRSSSEAPYEDAERSEGGDDRRELEDADQRRVEDAGRQPDAEDSERADQQHRPRLVGAAA